MLSRIPFLSSRPIFLLAAGLGLALFLLPQTATAQESTPAVQVPDTADAVVQIRGMACSACAQRMKGAMEDLESVNRAAVLLEKQEVLLTFAAEKIPSEKTLRKTVTSAGYEFRKAIFEKENAPGSNQRRR